MVIVVMGVSGCGKTIVGKLLASKLNVPFYDADNCHSESNIKKMKAGVPLDDNDRFGWLEVLAQKIRQYNNKDMVLACSALKRSYRDILAGGNTDINFVYLKGTKDGIAERMNDRKDHYMPTSLLDSQFAALEEPSEAIVVDVNLSPEKTVKQIVTALKK